MKFNLLFIAAAAAASFAVVPAVQAKTFKWSSASDADNRLDWRLIKVN